MTYTSIQAHADTDKTAPHTQKPFGCQIQRLQTKVKSTLCDQSKAAQQCQQTGTQDPYISGLDITLCQKNPLKHQYRNRHLQACCTTLSEHS